MSRYTCHRCGTPADVEPPVSRDAECEECGADLRCCMNCRHHAPGQHNSCAEPEAEMVEDKHRRNFCEYFEFSQAAWDSGSAQARRADDAREQLSSLFGDSGGTAKASESAREKLENLFGADKGASPDDRQKKARQELDRLFGGKSGADKE
jgi:hypothetical protein